MSIATELTGLINARTAMKTSITNKNVTVPSDTKMKDIAGLIRQIDQSEPAFNGTKWTPSNIKNGAGNPIYGLGVWTTGNYYSTDGKNWIACNPAGGKNVLRRYKQDNTTGGFVSYSGSTIYYSSDGISWSSAYTDSSGYSISYIVHTNSAYVALAYNSSRISTKLLYSYDGNSWNSVSSIPTFAYVSVSLISDSIAFAIEVADSLYRSTDGKNWGSVTPGIGCDYDDWMLANGDVYATVPWTNPSPGVYNGGLFINGSQYAREDGDFYYLMGSAFGQVYIGGSGGAASSYYNVPSGVIVDGKINDDYCAYYNNTYFISGCYSSSLKGPFTSSNIDDLYDDREAGYITTASGMWVGTNGYYSSNGKTWSRYKTIDGGNITFGPRIGYANGVWVACTEDGALYYSISYEQ